MTGRTRRQLIGAACDLHQAGEMTMQLICQKSMRYEGRELAVGERFTAKEREGKILVAIRRATLAPAVEAEQDDKSKRAYKRRDLTAET